MPVVDDPVPARSREDSLRVAVATAGADARPQAGEAPEPGGAATPGETPGPGEAPGAREKPEPAVWKLLAEIAMDASGEEDLGRMLLTTLDRLSMYLRFTGGSIALVEGDELVVRAAVGPFADEASGHRLARGPSRSWRVVETTESFLSRDLHAEGLAIGTPNAGSRVHSWLAVPLVRRGEGIGLFEVDSTEPDAFDREDVALLERVAVALSGPVEIASRHEIEARALAENRYLLGRLEARERQQATVASLGQAALSGAGLADLFDDSAAGVSRTLGVDIVSIVELDRAGRSLRLEACQGLQDGAIGTTIAIGRTSENGGVVSLPERTLLAGDALIVEDARDDPRVGIWPPAEPPSIASAACVPIGAGARRFGVLCAASHDRRTFRDDDLNFLRAVANVLATAVERHRIEVQESTARNLRNAFVGVISHELRTPITTIYGSSKLLQRPGSSMSDETRAQVLADIEAEADRLRRLVEDLLVLSRAESGRLDVSDEPILVGHIVRRATAAEQVRYPGWRFVVDVAADLPTSSGEETAVEQVVRNLITNAAKYSPAGSTIQVIAEAPGDEIVVRVLDEGVGIAADEVDRLFELFYRSAGAAKRASGAGIGLFVCRQLVEAMGGRVWASPRPTGGSEFGFALPVQQPEEFA